MSDLPSIAELQYLNRIAVLSIDSPPVNALSLPVREALLHAATRLDCDPLADALIIRCDGRSFFPGADLRELDQLPSTPTLPDVVNALENCSKPIIAAIHGSALGGGLEVALGCHLRIAADSARFGLPEVTLGIIPGAGGTQRLPRLIGVEAALKMIVTGTSIDATEAGRLGLLDRIVPESSLLECALQLAHEAIAGAVSIRKTGLLEVQASPESLFEGYLARQKRRMARQLAPAAAASVIHQGLRLPLEQALALERKVHLELREGEQSKALRHVFFAEREASKIPGLGAHTPTQPIRHVGIIGAGTMGAGIATCFLLNGMSVTLVEREESALHRGVDTIARTIDRNVASGKLDAHEADRMKRRLQPSLVMEELGSADLVIEAALESLPVKRAIFARLGSVARSDAILATNTSYLDINDIAADCPGPERVLGLHFFSPAHIMRLVEVVRTTRTSDVTLASAMKVVRKIDKIGVVCGVCYGFIGNRMLAVYREQAEQLILSGTSPYRIDRITEDFGFPMGPFRMRDLAGLDLGWSPQTSTGSTLRERLCESGRRGQKTGAGYYDYDAERRPSPSPFVEGLIRELAREQGVLPRECTDAQILDRLLWPTIAEGQRILAEGVATRSSDIDVVWTHGYGWPRWTGGPMYYAALRQHPSYPKFAKLL